MGKQMFISNIKTVTVRTLQINDKVQADLTQLMKQVYIVSSSLGWVFSMLEIHQGLRVILFQKGGLGLSAGPAVNWSGPLAAVQISSDSLSGASRISDCNGTGRKAAQGKNTPNMSDLG